MDTKQTVAHLEIILSDCEKLSKQFPEDPAFKKDIEAIQIAVEAVKENEKLKKEAMETQNKSTWLEERVKQGESLIKIDAECIERLKAEYNKLRKVIKTIYISLDPGVFSRSELKNYLKAVLNDTQEL